MTLVLDSNGVTTMTGDRAMVEAWLKRGYWPPVIPAPVLTECLTGDHRRDFHTNRFLRSCEVRDVTELIARHAAQLRTQAGRDTVSATDAIVAATADHAGGGIVLTSDSGDLNALAEHTVHQVHVETT